MNSPRRGIGQTTQARIVSHANTVGEPVWEVALAPEDVPGLGAAAIKAVGRFMSTMERLQERAESASVGDLLQELLNEVGYLEALRAERTIEAEGRLENLEELVGVGRDRTEGTGGLGHEEDRSSQAWSITAAATLSTTRRRAWPLTPSVESDRSAVTVVRRSS